MLASCGGETVKLWSLAALNSPLAPAALSTFAPHAGKKLNSIDWSPTTQIIASGGSDGNVILSHPTGAVLASLKSTELDDVITQVRFSSASSSGRHIVCGTGKGRIGLWEVKSRTLLKVIRAHTTTITALAMAPTDTHVASGSATGFVLLHNVTTGEETARLSIGSGSPVRALQFSSLKAATLAAAYDDGSVVVWDALLHTAVVTFDKVHYAPATSLAFSPVHSALMASGSLDKRVLFFDITQKKIVRMLNEESGVETLAFLHDGITLAAGTSSGKVVLHDLRKENEEPRVLLAHAPYSVVAVKFSQNGGAAPQASAPASNISSLTAKPTSVPPADVVSQKPRSATLPAAETALPPPHAVHAVNAPEDSILSPIRGPPPANSHATTSVKSSLLSRATANAAMQTVGVSPAVTTTAGTPGSSFLNDFSPAQTPLKQNMIDELLAATPAPPSRPAAAQPPSSALRGLPLSTVNAPMLVTSGPSSTTVPQKTQPHPPPTTFATPDLGNVFSPVRSSVVSKPANGTRSSSFFASAATPLVATPAASLTSTHNTTPPTDGISTLPLTTPAAKAALPPPIPTPTVSVPLPTATSILPVTAPQTKQPAPTNTAAARPMSASAISTPAPVKPAVENISPAPIDNSARDAQQDAKVSSALHVISALNDQQRDAVGVVLEEALERQRHTLRMDLQNLHLDMLRQFQLQQETIASLLTQHYSMKPLLEEIKALKEENERLKHAYSY